MGLSVSEQETTISFYRDSDECFIFTSDSTMMTRLDKLAKNADSSDWKCIQEMKLQGSDEVIGKKYVTNKGLISFRQKKTERTMTDEQRQAAAERLKAARKEKQQV